MSALPEVNVTEPAVTTEGTEPLSRAVQLSVVIPARDESENIGKTLDELTSRLDREPLSYELIVVDDGSRDDTADVVRRRHHGSIRLVVNNGPHGFGRAVRLGLESFSGQAVAIVMADGSDDPDDLVRYYEVLREPVHQSTLPLAVQRHNERIQGLPRQRDQRMPAVSLSALQPDRRTPAEGGRPRLFVRGDSNRVARASAGAIRAAPA